MRILDNMLGVFRCILIYLFCSCASQMIAQQNNVQWLIDLTDEVLEETDLCETCTWVNPIITRVRFGMGTFFFFRYSCAIDQGVSRMYNPSGTIVGECMTEGGDVSCMGSDAYTVYTFADEITTIWTCAKGFECFFAIENNIEQEVPIAIDDSRCVEGIKLLSVSDEYETFRWTGPSINLRTPDIEIDAPGTYQVTVTDAEGCIFTGEEEVEDIRSLEVNIKGPRRFCYNESATLRLRGFESYNWSTGATDSIIMVEAGGEYHVTVVNDLDCEGVGAFRIEEDAPLDVEIYTEEENVQEGDTIEVTFTSDESAASPVGYQWFAEGTLTCVQCSVASFIPLLDNTLMLTVLDDEGCSTEAFARIPVQELSLDVYVPNIIKSSAPNENNRFMVFGGGNIRQIERLAIFDRWGNMVFLQKRIMPDDQEAGWNGRNNGVISTEDIYGFAADILFINGKRKSMAGEFLLLH